MFEKLNRAECVNADDCPELMKGKIYVVKECGSGVHHSTGKLGGCLTLYLVRPSDVGVAAFDVNRFRLFDPKGQTTFEKTYVP